MTQPPNPGLSAFLPLVTCDDGQPYISCLAVAALLEYCAAKIRMTGLDANAAADLLASEADALNVRAIALTAP
ncbi:hypothetical protein ACIOUE_00865 [Streptomyces xanthochromogenes]|uniref:hypothetical protein n=1 Tax=Streptomyces xanthochromogenes TaxID=67384 RepID=UPI00381E9DF3